MKYGALLLFVMVGLLAIISGWLLESRDDKVPELVESDFPVEIDYFLKTVSIKVTNDQGMTDYILRSPYLDHLTGDDISRISEPEITVFRDDNNWQVTANQGELLHKLNWFELQQDARLQRTGEAPMLVTSDQLLFEPDKDIVAAKKPLKMITDDARIEADGAIFDMTNKIHTLRNTKAVYYNEKT